MGICKYCCSDKAVPCFVIPMDCGYEGYMVPDSTLQITMSSYDVVCDAKRLVFQAKDARFTDPARWEDSGLVRDMPQGASLLDYVLIRDAAGAADETTAVIDGKCAVVRPIDSAKRPQFCRHLACSECHTILPFHRFTSGESVRRKKSEFRAVLIANTSAGKTNLTAAMYDVFNQAENGYDIRISEPVFEMYHRKTADDLHIRGTLPKSTQHATPPLSVQFQGTNGKLLSIDIIDTKGEITRKGNIDLTPCIDADLIIFLVDIRIHDGTRDAADGERYAPDYITDLEWLNDYIAALSNHVRDKRIILAFSKCDRYAVTAADFMFSGKIDFLPREHLHQNLRNLRNYRFSNDLGEFIDAVCGEISEEEDAEATVPAPDEDELIAETFFSAPEKQKKPAPKDHGITVEKSRVQAAIQSIVSYCNNISRCQTDIMCIAPLGGKPAADTKTISTEENNPLYVGELIELIKLYAEEFQEKRAGSSAGRK